MISEIVSPFAQLLTDIDSLKGRDFSGVGLIFTNAPEYLPIASLKNEMPRIDWPISDYNKILNFLLTISLKSNPYHDGFHVITKPFTLTAICQYFSAPIVPSDNLEFKFGSRYRTAFYGSFIDNIIACGVVSSTHEPAIFIKGEKIELR